MPDLLVRGIHREAGLRIVAAVTTDLVVEAARRHQICGVGACALGRGLTSSLLLATLSKASERVTLQIQGDGPLQGLVADANVEPGEAGSVRGYLVRPEAAITPVAGRCSLASVLGRHGVVNVMRDLGLKERYHGQVPLITGEVDEDVESYLRVSEQVPSALGCDVLVDGDRARAAAGFLVQALPDGDEEGVREAQHRLRTGGIHDFLAVSAAAAGAGGAVAVDPRAFAEAILGRPIDFLGEQPVRFRCQCSRGRVEDVLHLLTPIDIDEMMAERGHAEVTCNFCNERYVVDRPDLERVRADLAHGPRENN